MSTKKMELDFNGIPQPVQGPLAVFSSDLDEKLGQNLAGITVVGSSLGEDYKPGLSDINTVLVLDRLDQGVLKAVASQAKGMHKKRVAPPLLMTEPYIKRSLDVFAVELLDFQLVGKAIWGSNPFADLHFVASDVRLQCEREFKAMLIRLRQGYIAAAGNSRLLRDVLVATAKTSLPYLRAMLWLKDQQRESLVDATFTAASGQFGVELDPLREVHRWREEKPRLRETELESAFERVYAAVDGLAAAVDGLEVGS